MSQYVICADGACSGNPGPGGWAYEIWRDAPADGNGICGDSGGSPETTNNAMELSAAINAFRALLSQDLAPGSVKLRFDSEYVLKGLFEWLAGWKARGWKTAGKKPVKNRPLWEELDALLTRAHGQGWSFAPDWVKGHDGDFGNERVDEMAAARRDEAKEIAAFNVMTDDVITAKLESSGLPSPVTPEASGADISDAEVAIMRGILDGYARGDHSVKSALAAIRANAKALGIL